MLESAITGCHALSEFCASVRDEASQLAFASVLTLMNLTMLAKTLHRHGRVRRSESRLGGSAFAIWQAGNVSIVLWLLCLLIIRRGTQ